MSKEQNQFEENKNEETKKILEKHAILTPNVMNNIIRTMTNSFCITDTETMLTRVTLGIINRNETREMNKLYKMKKTQKSLSVKLLHKIAKKIYEKIWKKRNETINVNK
ncbi:32425_t:CDS:1, partial [Gigaspora margarita]